MDGVLCDFDSMFNRYSDIKVDSGYNYEQKYGTEKFWNIVNSAGLEFWTDMPWMPMGRELWNRLINSGNNVSILSKPATTNTNICKKGKIIWCKQNLGNVNVILESNKYIYAGKNKILIDDLPVNVDKWIEHDGIGILCETPRKTIDILIKNNII